MCGSHLQVQVPTTWIYSHSPADLSTSTSYYPYRSLFIALPLSFAASVGLPPVHAVLLIVDRRPQSSWSLVLVVRLQKSWRDNRPNGSPTSSLRLSGVARDLSNSPTNPIPSVVRQHTHTHTRSDTSSSCLSQRAGRLLLDGEFRLKPPVSRPPADV